MRLLVLPTAAEATRLQKALDTEQGDEWEVIGVGAAVVGKHYHLILISSRCDDGSETYRNWIENILTTRRFDISTPVITI